MTSLPENHPKRTSGWLGWAIFLGVSWTWCIGMFLPVLLIRDYGVWAWVVFAVPNVVGAAAMGWTISAERSRLMVSVHRFPVTAFSAVTIAFQLYFAAWIFTRSPMRTLGFPWFLLGVALVAAAATLRGSSRLLAGIIFAASACCALEMFHHDQASFDVQKLQLAFDTAPSAAVACLVPVCLFGFLLCPYLDSTFHRARQSLTAADARLAFGFGFGVIFFSAIVLSLLYANNVGAAMNAISSLALRWIKVYWMLQLGFTTGAHLIGDDELNQAERAKKLRLLAIFGVSVALLAMLMGPRLMGSDENVYCGFLAFYGLIFPAYVWLCMIPGRGVVQPDRRAMNVFAFAVAVAAPMFWLAFIGHQLVWGVPGVAVVLLSRAFISKPARKTQSEIQVHVPNGVGG